MGWGRSGEIQIDPCSGPVVFQRLSGPEPECECTVWGRQIAGDRVLD